MELRPDESKSRYESLIPYPYQDQIYRKIKENWSKENGPEGKRFGNIVFLETGTGKTYIAIMLLKAIFLEESIMHREISEREIFKKVKETEIGERIDPLKDLQKKYTDRMEIVDKLTTL